MVTMDRRSSFGDPFSRYALEREFEDIAAVAAAVGGEVDLLGWSSGAICSLGAAPRIPRLRRLVLYEPPLPGPHWPDAVARMRAMLAAGKDEGIAEVFLSELLRLPGPVVSAIKQQPDWPARVERGRLQPREMDALASSTFAPERFRALRVPVTFLAGANTPAGHHHRGFIAPLQSVLTDFRVVEIPGQEHFAPRAAPALFAALVLEIIGGSAGAAANRPPGEVAR
jgi:pimeloyl-ACP methyl ester carboxylesterase